MKLIWATRGRTWGYRFLLEGGCDDPLPVYDQAFATIGDQDEVCRRSGDTVALRFPDPEGRRDDAGRVIGHDFVVFRPARTSSPPSRTDAVWPGPWSPPRSTGIGPHLSRPRPPRPGVRRGANNSRETTQ